MAPISDKAQSLLSGKNFGMLGIVGSDGAAQVTPVWVEFDGDSPSFNTATGRPKLKHMQRDPRVTLTLIDHENPYTYVELRGTVELSEGDAAEAQIDRLAKKYIDQDVYPWRQPTESRVSAKLNVTKELGM